MKVFPLKILLFRPSIYTIYAFGHSGIPPTNYLNSRSGYCDADKAYHPFNIYFHSVAILCCCFTLTVYFVSKKLPLFPRV